VHVGMRQQENTSQERANNQDTHTYTNQEPRTHVSGNSVLATGLWLSFGWVDSMAFRACVST
jgi:hypothetical protein